MKKILILFFFIFSQNSLYANTSLAYLDIQYIIDNSNLGKFYKSKIVKIQNNNKSRIIPKEKEIKKLEDEFNKQKNLLKKDEIKKKIDEINLLVKEYQTLRNNLNNKLVNEKKKYSKEILLILNPLLTNYVESNNINLVIEKKNILVGIKSLDITNELLKIFDEKTTKINKENVN